MLALKDLIARLPVPGLKESYERQQIATCVSQVCGVPITAKMVTVRDQVATLAVPPVVKSAIGVRKQDILTAIVKEGVILTDIR